MAVSASYLLLLVTLAICFVLSLAQVPGRGKCPDIQVQVDFNSNKYLGAWYEYERFFAAFEIGGICGHANYSAKPNGHIGVLNQGINKWTKKPTSVVGDAYAPNPNVPAKLEVTFPVGGPFAKGNYWVVETDYDSYAVVWSCTALDLKILDIHGDFHGFVSWLSGKSVCLTVTDDLPSMYCTSSSRPLDLYCTERVTQAIAWILTRKRGVLSEQKRTEIYDMFKNYDVNPNYFKRVQQDGCSN